MKKVIFATSLLLMSSVAWSGELIRNGKIVEIGSNYDNSKDFTVKIEGGIGLCNTWVVFPEAKAPSPEAHRQAFEIALAAATHGRPVRIHNFENNSCEQANFISMGK